MYNKERFEPIKEAINEYFSNTLTEIISKHTEELKEYTNKHMKDYSQKLLCAIIEDKDLTEFGFNLKEDFYKHINTWAVRNKLRKDFREDLVNDIMGDLQRQNRRYKKAIDVIVKLIKKNECYIFNDGFYEIKKELKELGIEF